MDIGTDSPSLRQAFAFLKFADPMTELGVWPHQIAFQTPLGNSTLQGTGLEYLEMVFLHMAQTLDLPLCGFDVIRDFWIRHGLLSWDKLIDKYDRKGMLFYLDPPYWDCEDDYCSSDWDAG